MNRHTGRPQVGQRVWLQNPDERGLRHGKTWARKAEAARWPWRNGDTGTIVAVNGMDLTIVLDRTSEPVKTSALGMVDRYYDAAERALAVANAKAAGYRLCQHNFGGLGLSWGWWHIDADGYQVGAGYSASEPTDADPEPVSTGLCRAFVHRHPPCAECGQGVTADDGDGWCFTCRFWLSKVGDPGFLRCQDAKGRVQSYAPRRVGIQGGDRSCLGFGGAVLRFQLTDGRVLVSNDVFTQGEVPDRFLDRLPVNATLLAAER